MLVKKRRIASVAKIKKKAKSPRQIERHIKVLQITKLKYFFLFQKTRGLMSRVFPEICAAILRRRLCLSRLAQAGLVRKNYRGRTVTHELSPYGWTFCKFLKTFQHS